MTTPAAASLSPDEWRQVFSAADEALELNAESRGEFVAQFGAESPALGSALRAMLASADDASPLDTPAAALAARLLANLPDGPHVTPPSRLGPYRIVELLGRGGMGAVYLAERADDQFRKRVAVKVLPSWSAADEHRVRRLVEERQILAALEHPDIARLVDGGVTAGGLPWFAMEYVAGVPIDEYCDSHDLSIERRLELFRRVCAAVAYAHRNLIVHRDLKPGNILVTADGAVKLLDFGIAKLLGAEAEAARTRTGERVMTPLYASPEQVRGGPISTASDVYALGVLLHELLTGRDPYRLSSHESYEVTHAIVEREPERASLSVGRTDGAGDVGEIARARNTTPGKLRRRLEGDLDVIVATALQKDPAQRYRSVEQLDEDVQRHLAGLPIAAQGESRVYRARKFVRRHKAAAAAAIAFVLVVLLFTVLTGIQAMRLRAEANRVAAERGAAEAAIRFISNFARTSIPSRNVRKATSRELLDSASARVEAALPAQPATRAQLMYEFGRAYHELGDDERAQHLLESSLGLRRTVQPLGERELDETLDALGAVLLDRGDIDGAERAYQEALAVRRRLLGADHRDVARSLNGLAAVRLRQGRARDAEVLARQALDIDRRRPGANAADVAQSQRRLAQALADGGDDVRAQRLYREALSLLHRVAPDGDLDVAGTELDLAASAKRSGDHAFADSLFRHATGVYRTVTSTIALANGALSPSWSAPPPPKPPVLRAVRSPGSKIVFVSDRDGPDPTGDLGRNEIYIMNPDGSDQRRLTNSDTLKLFPAISPDGRKIVYQAQIGGTIDLFVMNVDGSGVARLTNQSEAHLGALRAAWSPDGGRIAFQSMAQPNIYVINADGTGVQRLTSQPGASTQPTWSPDGRRIAFTGERDGKRGIYVMNADGTNPVLLIGGDSVRPSVFVAPAWSPDGGRIAFVKGESPPEREIYVINRDGTGLVRLTTNDTEDSRPAWSPDGSQIVFFRRVIGHAQIFVMNADGSGERRLTDLSPVSFSAFPSWGRAARASPLR